MKTNRMHSWTVKAVVLVFLVIAVSPTIAGDKINPELTQILNKRVEVLQQLYDYTNNKFKSGLVGLKEVTTASNQLLFARLEATANKSERIKILEEAIENMKRVEALMAARYEQGTSDFTDCLTSQAERLSIEIQLCRERIEK